MTVDITEALQWAYEIVPHTSLPEVQKRNIKELAKALEQARADFADEAERADEWQRRAIEAEQERDDFSLKYSRAVNDLNAAIDERLVARWQPLFEQLAALDDEDLALVVHSLSTEAKRTLRKHFGVRT